MSRAEAGEVSSATIIGILDYRPGNPDTTAEETKAGNQSVFVKGRRHP
jgi:hypothetical protein